MSGDRRKGGRGEERVEIEERGREGGRERRRERVSTRLIVHLLISPFPCLSCLSSLTPPSPCRRTNSSRLLLPPTGVQPLENFNCSPLPLSFNLHLPPPTLSCSPLPLLTPHWVQRGAAGDAAGRDTAQSLQDTSSIQVRSPGRDRTHLPPCETVFLSLSSQVISLSLLSMCDLALPPFHPLSPNLFSCLSLLLCPSLPSLISCSLPLHCNYCTLRHKY